MANAKSALEKVNKEFGIKSSTTPKKDDKRKQSTSASSKSASTQKNNTSKKNPKSALEKVNKEFGITGKYTYSPPPKKKTNTKKYTDFSSETQNAYTSAKDRVTNKTTIKSNLSDTDRKKRISEINSEINTLKSNLVGYSRASTYGTNQAMKNAKKRDEARIAELSEELKSLERVGTFSASELKQFEIDDAKKKEASARQKVNSFGARPTAASAEAYKQAVSEQYKAGQTVKQLEKQKSFYDDIEKYGNVVNKEGVDVLSDEFSQPVRDFFSKANDFESQWRANYRSTDLSEKSGLAFNNYIDNPTEENRDIAMAYQAFVEEYMKNNEKALDDEGQVLPLLSDQWASHLAQTKGQMTKGVPMGIAGALLGLGVDVASQGATGGKGLKTGWTLGYSAGAGLHSYEVIRGSLFAELISYGLDEETAKQLATDDAIVEGLIESGETAKDWAFMLAGGIKGKVFGKSASKSTSKAAELAAKYAAHPYLNLGKNVVMGTALNSATEYLEEFSQGGVSRATREKALSMIDNEIGQYGEGNIDLHNRPIYKNSDGTISTVDSVTYEVDGKYVVLPTIVRDENGNARRLESDDEIFAHYVKTGEYLGEFNTLEEANGYANSLHYAQSFRYSDNTSTDADDSLVVGGAKVIADALFGGNTEAREELHGQGVEGFKTGLVSGGIHGTARFIVSSYANAKTIKKQNEIADFIKQDEELLDDLIATGKENGTVSSELAEEVEQAKEKGEVTREQVKKLIVSNTVYENAKEETPDTMEQPESEERVIGEINDRMRTTLGDGDKAVGIADGQAYVSNGKIFIPVNDADMAKIELGATESSKVGTNVSKLLTQSDFTSIQENPVEGKIEGIGLVNVFTDTNGREIAVKKEVAEFLEGYNLEATFRGGKPYAIKATDNDGNIAGVAMAIGLDTSGEKYQLTDVLDVKKSNVPYNVMSLDNPLMQERNAREAYIKQSTGYGQYGVRAFADIMESVEQNEAPIVAKAFQAAYEAGLTNLDTAKANLPSEVHRIAFNAGKQDFIMENAGKVENIKNVKSHGDKAGFDSTNIRSDVSKQAIDLFDRFCKELGTKAWMSGDSDLYNANLTPNVGAVQIANDFRILDFDNDAVSLSFLTHGLHEVASHRAEELAPVEYAEFKREMYNYKNSVSGISLANTKRQSYGERGVDISLSEAMSEVTSNSILEIYDNDINLLKEGLERVLNGTNTKAIKGANVFKQALDYVIKKFNQFLEKLGVEARIHYKASLDETIRLRNLFENTLSAAIAKNKEIAKSSSNLVTVKDGVVVDSQGNVVAQINEDGTATFSLKTFDDSGRAELHKWLNNNVKNKKLTEAEAKDISDQLEYFYGICKQYEDKYAPFSAWSKAEVVKGLDGKPLMSVVKANGDYSMNLDFSLVCKKRRPLDALYRAMIDDGFMDNIGQLSEIEVARINEIIRKNGFETACTLCFVDSKRYRQYAVADAFVSKYNELVRMLAPEGVKIDRFDFSGKREASADGLHTMTNEELKAGINKLNKVIKEHGETTVVGKIAKHLKAVARDRKLVMVSDFMDSEGFVRVKQANPAVFKLYNSSKGSGGPKATLPDVQYLGEILKGRGFTAKKAYSVGGVRVQSFSDYIPRLVFDYLQMTADLSAKKLPAHAYSKEDIFVMQFGKTGIKINMSLVPAVAKDGIAAGLDKDGNYVWVDGHTFASDFHDKGSGQRGFELAVKIQNTEGYSQNCGTIAVGVSDEHIIKMLKDNNIRMVIPYHKSSLNHFVAQMGNIDQYKDYTNVQNTRVRDGDKLKKIEGKDFNFNEAFHRLGDAKAATKEYLAWCKKNNYIPKFDTFAFHEDAEVRENYYKVLIDFAAYDSEGNATPQGAVTMNFPTENDAFGSMKELIEKGLEADAILEGRKTKDIPKILKEVKAELGKKTEGKKFSLKAKDQEYLELAKNPEKNEARLREMVDEAAKRAGFPTRVYHGTNRFGFTQIATTGVEESVDWSPFFTSDSIKTAGTYAVFSKERNINEEYEDVSAVEDFLEEVDSEIDDAIGEFCADISRYFSEWFFGYDGGTTYVRNIVEDFDNDIYAYLTDIVADAYGKYGDGKYEDFAEWQENSEDWEKIESSIISIESLVDKKAKFYSLYETSGIYGMYANTDGFFEIDCKGNNWNALEDSRLPDKEGFTGFVTDDGEEFATYASAINHLVDKINEIMVEDFGDEAALDYKDTKTVEVDDGVFTVYNSGYEMGTLTKKMSKVKYRTRDVALWAEDNGYKGVIFKNIVDNGGFGSSKASNVYTFFNPQEQVKSADLVTYDDDGNIIPLSERFNKHNDDIRYSLKDSEGKTLTTEQAEYFKDSKVRDSNGNLLVVYHGSPAKFTVFDHYHINKRGNSHGRGFYFTEKKSLAEGYEKEGGQLLKGYLNITKPLSEEKKTMKKADLLKLIKATCEAEARMIVEDGGYDNVREALRDTWISNCVNTYEMSMDSAYREALNIFWNGNDNDVELISDLTNSGAGNENTLRQVHDVLGYDGVIYTAPDGTHEFVSLVSEQFKSVDNTKPTSNPDINYSLKGTERDIPLKDIPKVRKAVADKNADVLAKYVESGAISTEVYNQLIEEFGAIPTGEKPSRDVQVPQRTAKDKKVSQTVRTILEAEVTPEEDVPIIQKMVEDGIFSYDVYTDKAAIEDGENYIKTHGWEESLDDWFDAVNSGEVSKEITTTGWILYNHAANSKDTKTAIRILDAMVRHQRSAAQALQATRILKKLSPEAQLYGVKKSVEAFQKELTDKYGDKAPDLKIDEELAEKFLNAETEEERLDAEIELYKDIGRQMPSDWLDMWNAWRYLSMLGNLRTHGRNILGNAFFAPVVNVKNIIATGMESGIAYGAKLAGKEMNRSKAFLNSSSKYDRSLISAAYADYANVADAISNGGKYNDSAMGNQYIQKGKTIFKSNIPILKQIAKGLEWARKGNSNLLELEDVWFSKPHYAYALAQYCKANNITPEQIQRGKAIGPAREYAIREASKATYRDLNAFSHAVSSLGRNGAKANENEFFKAGRMLVEGILPFRKTPANILVRGVEYSPLGMIKGIADIFKIGKETKKGFNKGHVTTASEVIDRLSAGLTGTGLYILGWFMAKAMLVRGHGEDDEKEKDFKEMMGHQAYSLETPDGKSYTLDWLAPEALPFFMGVNSYEINSRKKPDERLTMSDMITIASRIGEPMLEMSCLQGINDAIENTANAKYDGNTGLGAFLYGAATSYFMQGLPTLLGQAERTGEEERMTTFVQKDAFLTKGMQRTLGKASAKIPYWDYNQIPYIDAWGRKEASGVALKRGLNNFLNPAYTSTIETSSMENELLRLYEMTGEASVFPSRADKKVTVDGTDIYLTADEYVRYATLKGEKSYKAVSDLVKSKGYKALSNEEKVKAIEDAYDYANQKAKQYISNYKPQKWVEKADDFGSNVSSYISFRTEVASTKEANDDKITKQQVADIILDMAQNDSETWKMYLSMYDSEGDKYAHDKGVSGEDYMYFLEALQDVDKPSKSGKYGSYTQDEARWAVNRLDGLTRQEKAILWQSVNTTWKKNPYR